MSQYTTHCTWNLTTTTGTGSDKRRKAIIGSHLDDETLFRTHRTQFKKQFRGVADKMGQRVVTAVMAQSLLVEVDLGTLRDEHQILESERDFGLRQRVAEEVEGAKSQMERLCSAIAEVVGEAGDVSMSG
jgi:hypothetical protein